MKRIFAPWRLKYVSSGNKYKGCLFCDKYNSDDNKKNYVIKKTDNAFVLFNLYPYNNGHVMVASKRHVADINDLTKEERSELFELAIEIKKVLANVLNPHGFNLGINCGEVAGAGIAEHIHMHILPRWSGDTNFMTTIADTRVIPQSFDDLYEKIMEFF